MANRKQDLAQVLQQIEKAHEGTETVASQILQVLRDEGITNLHQFDLLVRAAYARNGWSQRVGRPQEGDVPAPAIIKVYVSTIRAGYRRQVQPETLQSMAELRRAVKLARTAALATQAANETPDSLQGVSITAPNALTGAPLHDLYVLRVTLPAEQQERLDAALERLMQQFTKKAPQHLQLVHRPAANS